MVKCLLTVKKHDFQGEMFPKIRPPPPSTTAGDKKGNVLFFLFILLIFLLNQGQYSKMVLIKKVCSGHAKYLLKKLEIFGGHLFSEDDHSHWAPPYWNMMKETFSLGRTEL